MDLKKWRKARKMSQAECAKKLEEYAAEKHPDKNERLPQTTYGYWERGTMPRKFWLAIIQDFTRNKVTAEDFVPEA